MLKGLETIADVVLAIEAQLRDADLWESIKPDSQALLSSQPFCYDTLKFHQWLQWIFVPRMKQIIEADGPLPSESLIKPMAEEFLDPNCENTPMILQLLGRFDELINQKNE